MQLDILTPGRKLFEGEVTLVQLPGILGSFEIMNNHAPMISALGKGKVKVVNGQNKPQYFDINGGVVEVKSNKIILLAD